MDANERETLNCLAEAAIGAAYEVANHLGGGFLEKVYRKALLHELQLRSIRATDKGIVSVTYKGQCVGNYAPDILVEGRLIIELKCVDRLADEHLAQCLNYLKATGKSLALLINFQKSKVEWKRVVDQF